MRITSKLTLVLAISAAVALIAISPLGGIVAAHFGEIVPL